MDDLSHTYEEIRIVNRAFAKRLASIQEEDASRNAIVRLDSLASITSFSISEQWSEDIGDIFKPYLAAEAEQYARQTDAISTATRPWMTDLPLAHCCLVQQGAIPGIYICSASRG